MKLNRVLAVAVFLAFFAAGSNSMYAQKGKTPPPKLAYEIKFVFPNLPDSILYVAYYFADKTYMFDTLYVERKMPYTFIMKGDSALTRGQYVVASEAKVKLFDFIVDSSFFFTIKTEPLDPERIDIMKTLEFINSPENSLPAELGKKMSNFVTTIQAMMKELKEKENLTPEQREQHEANISRYRDTIQLYRDGFLETHKSSLFSKMIRAAEDISVPEAPQNPDGSPVDSAWSYQYYINHYWDNCDFTDPALIRTPYLHPIIVKYFDKVIIPIPDTVNKYADLLIEKVKNTPELYRYVIQYITYKYETSQYVGHDAIFVHMVKKYYEKGLCEWVDEEVLKAMLERANQLDKILIGRVAPHLYMPDTNNVLRSNYEFDKKYTIMWFWDIDCGHCKTATPILKEFYDRAKDSLDFEVYAVCIGTDSVKWKNAIIEKKLTWVNVGKNTANINYKEVYAVNSTPVVFILDKEKKIIAKKVDVKEIEDIIRSYEAGRKIR